MIIKCPQISCDSLTVKKDGSYFRANDSQKVQRYKCSDCGKRFSRSTLSLEYRQKKRRINHLLFNLLASGNSQRRCAYILNVNKKTIERRLYYLSLKAKSIQDKVLFRCINNPVQNVQFDDLITIEHTKLKPLSISTAVEKKTRLILGAQISQIPAFGHLAKISQAKYGYRKSTHKQALNRLFCDLSKIVATNATFESDKHKSYPEFIKIYFPDAEHKSYKGGRGCITGQGELKKRNFDPLFSINHTYAMFRANINRLFRKSWCTTKDPVRLKYHIDIYIAFHNQRILNLK